MLTLSQTAGYAVRALSQMATRPQGWTLARDLAARTQIPLPYLSKILQALAKAQLIRGKRGYRGGFMLARPADQVRLLDVVEAIDGESCFLRCLLGLEVCSDERACPTHALWSTVRGNVVHELSRLSLADVARFESAREKLAEIPGGVAPERAAHVTGA